jgi:hypothetical protein
MFSKKMLLTTPTPYQGDKPAGSVRMLNQGGPSFRRLSISQTSVPPITQMPIQPSPQSKTVVEKTGGESLHGKVMKWGEPTWFLFHTLSVKIKEEEFIRVKDDLLNMVYSICVNLPCPICSDHAKEYFKTVNFRAIQSKTQLIDFFYQFHNMVNKRKHFEPFPRDQVEEKYNKAITKNIFLYFQQGFNDHSFNPKHISDQYIRLRVLKGFNEWFYKNAYAFAE